MDFHLAENFDILGCTGLYSEMLQTVIKRSFIEPTVLKLTTKVLLARIQVHYTSKSFSADDF